MRKEGRNPLFFEKDLLDYSSLIMGIDFFYKMWYILITKGVKVMKKAIKRFNFCYYVMGMPLFKCIKAALFGKKVFKFGD